MQGIKNWKVTVKPWGIQLPAIPLAIKPVTSKSNKKKELQKTNRFVDYLIFATLDLASNILFEILLFQHPPIFHLQIIDQIFRVIGLQDSEALFQQPAPAGAWTFEDGDDVVVVGCVLGPRRRHESFRAGFQDFGQLPIGF